MVSPELRYTGPERRRSRRVDSYLPLRICELDKAGLEIWKHEMNLPVSRNDRESNPASGIANIKLLLDKPDLSRKDFKEALMALDRKLDAVLEMLHNKEAVDSAKVEEVHLDISATGMCFASDREQTLGITLGLEIFGVDKLPFPVRAIGKVLRVEKNPRWKKPFTVAVKFAAIRDDDRERLVKYCS